MARLRADGFDGVQVTSSEPPSPGVMTFCGLDRINSPQRERSKHDGSGRGWFPGRGAERADGGGVLPLTQVVRITFLLVEEAAWDA